jgi:hypothetical protein
LDSRSCAAGCSTRSCRRTRTTTSSDPSAGLLPGHTVTNPLYKAPYGNDVSINLHQKDNRDEGGTGYGDSGGPTLLNGTAIAVVSTGDVPCWSTSVNTRTDTQAAADFLRPYLALK